MKKKKPKLEKLLAEFRAREEEINATRILLNRLEHKHMMSSRRDFGVAHGDPATIPSNVAMIMKVLEMK